MFKRILVPLDGSRLSARALPYAAEIGQHFRGAVILIRVVPFSPIDPIGTYTLPEVLQTIEKSAHDKDRKNLASARRYLKRKLKRIISKGIKGSQYAILGTPAQSIIDFSRSADVDLIIMTTHNKRGLKRALLGSVSDEVVRESGIPVLTIPP
jgi:nucleotide-binding universal stress UspA family protein